MEKAIHLRLDRPIFHTTRPPLERLPQYNIREIYAVVLYLELRATVVCTEFKQRSDEWAQAWTVQEAEKARC